jgi:hypothetical protein
MKRDGTWLTDAEIAPVRPAILCGLALDAGNSDATDVDVFLQPGHNVNRVLFVNPPRALRIELRRGTTAVFPVAEPGPYTFYALPRIMDPTLRTEPVALPPATLSFDVASRPVVQEFRLPLQRAE